MTYNVLVIPEDATKDHYILKPIVQAMLGHAGRPHARVRVMIDPAVQGISNLTSNFLEDVIQRYPMVDAFVLCVDRDGVSGRDTAMSNRETAAQAHLLPSQSFFATTAHQELEVWCLAGMDDLPKGWRWQAIRADASAKENYYEPYAGRRGLLDAPGDGREILGREAATRYRAVRTRCGEVAQLEQRF
ncbi:hypothetical protein [Blastococcus sp. PRF04-17]|uniref:hypothetical protein n=1 Tax=Blastococcus sp. PRF04-17 TaxID=2933797 RepID=UPI001FF6CF7C|nr:hypothetical protein [Blastococcus sp. PRF04-17]UOY02728.1 hypothetical protein MVA48_05010 [Blastococcus sp. PRF04-17]